MPEASVGTYSAAAPMLATYPAPEYGRGGFGGAALPAPFSPLRSEHSWRNSARSSLPSGVSSYRRRISIDVPMCTLIPIVCSAFLSSR